MNNSTLDTQNARLTGDIDLSAIDNWEPIGNDTTQYTGTFDGCGYSITGLTIDSTGQYVGLFGYIGADGTVKNLTVSASENGIKANYSSNFGCVGAVAGQSDGTITNCTFASGSVTGSGNYACVGGIVGNFSNGTISNCTNNGKVVGNNDNGRSGGICGVNNNSGNCIISNCTNNREISGAYAGGIVGMNYVAVSNCINTGSINGEMDAGGIAGGNYASISNCVSTGNVTGGATYNKGGIAGDGSRGSLSDCGWLNYDGTLTNPTGNGGNIENVGAFTEDQLGLVVTSLTLSPNPVTVNGTAAVDFILAPANPAPDGAFGDFGAVRSGEVKYTLADDGIASASYSNGKITLTGKAVGETTMTVEVTLHTTDFSTLNNETPGYVSDDNASKLTFAVPVNVTAAASSGSGSSGSAGGGGGGCNAGAGALALLALLPLFALKRGK